MTPPPDYISPENTAELDALLRAGVQEALATTDFATAFAAFRADLPNQAPHLIEMMPPNAERAIAYSMFREIWNHVPRPDHDWKPLPRQKPERNAACPCGSGQKYKQCCGLLDGSSPFGTDDFSVLAYVLETVPVSQYKSLPFNRLNPDELAHVAQQWRADGRKEAAAALLEPLLAPVAKLDGRHEYAFDTLCDVYLDMGDPARRVALAEQLMQSTDRGLKVAAMHRRCTMLADAGDYAAAWQLFKDTQRLDPDNPALSHLEVVLLASQGEIEPARQRAQFWATRLRKLDNASDELIDYLEKIARDPQILLELMDGERAVEGDERDGDDTWADEEDDDNYVEAAAEDIEALLTLVNQLPAPSCQHRLSPQDGQAGPLQPEAPLAALESTWFSLFRGENAERDPWQDTRWLPWLAKHPLAWQSFLVLDDIVATLEEVMSPPDYDDMIDWLEETLLNHAVALLRENIAANHAENCSLAWGWPENRPALRLVAQLAELLQGSAKELPLLEWLVLTLNPDDNAGHRVALVHRLCEAGRAAAALAVCDRYAAADLAGLQYGRVLALQQLGRLAEAKTALAKAKKSAPLILKTLFDSHLHMPENLSGSMSAGSREAAWFYRMDFLASWQKTDALAWLQPLAGHTSTKS